ncbi:hypothetical protein BOTBODRAFT_484023 [Botryobasidium botryosum FD-172 SS1]|uniref:Uncharacterized protein n=1 Tax=Botryobasidium botryosum (strain FD-172 SS1) TaxID=930990 RepID=A0A067MWM4_BOTB1|nr:hypothetical protein BOTBODRAFT_484023 [Botryobasidium botryosum FD-172 SS1]
MCAHVRVGPPSGVTGRGWIQVEIGRKCTGLRAVKWCLGVGDGAYKTWRKHCSPTSGSSPVRPPAPPKMVDIAPRHHPPLFHLQLIFFALHIFFSTRPTITPRRYYSRIRGTFPPSNQQPSRSSPYSRELSQPFPPRPLCPQGQRNIWAANLSDLRPSSVKPPSAPGLSMLKSNSMCLLWRYCLHSFCWPWPTVTPIFRLSRSCRAYGIRASVLHWAPGSTLSRDETMLTASFGLQSSMR